MDRLHLTDSIVNYVSFRSERGYQDTNPSVTKMFKGPNRENFVPGIFIQTNPVYVRVDDLGTRQKFFLKLRLGPHILLSNG
jgi:hypothetical protein